ncbi:MAG: ATP-binding protein [bacterium]
MLEQLKEDALETASQHMMQYIQLEGEVGIGKSNLLKALAHWLGRRGWLVLKGRFFDPERRPFQGWDGVITAIRDLLENLPSGVYDALKPDIDAATCMFPELGGDPLGDGPPVD